MESMPGLSELPYTDNTDRKGALWASIQADRRVYKAAGRNMGSRHTIICPDMQDAEEVQYTLGG